MAVRTDWRDSKSLLGYYNPLTGTYEWTEFLRFLVQAEQNYRGGSTLAWFVILDEMNLARVEYYFADLLSVLESGRGEDGLTREPLRLSYPEEAEGDLPPRELRLPPSLYIIGTVNVDETTHSFSSKVLDRAFTIELTQVDFENYPPLLLAGSKKLDPQQRQSLLNQFARQGKFAQIDKREIATFIERHPEVREHLQRLNEGLALYNLHFGYRVFDEIVSFVAAGLGNRLFDTLGGFEPALDAGVLMKVLPKFNGSRSKLEMPLRKVLAWCLNPSNPDDATIDAVLSQISTGYDAMNSLSGLKYRYGRTAERARRMLGTLYNEGFAAFG